MSGEVVCGWHAVQAVLERRPRDIEAIWLSDARADRRVAAIEAAAKRAQVRLHRATREELDELAGGERHQGVVARLQRRGPQFGEADLPKLLEQAGRKALLLVLDNVQDPHNLGACLRSAAAAGAHAVIVPRDRSAPLTPVARRASAGAAETVPLVAVANLARTLRLLKDQGVWVYGASHDVEPAIYDTDLSGPVALVLGGEGAGLRQLTREHCDGLFCIPMAGTVESLNVSVASGICLFEVVRQRRTMPGKSAG